MCFTNAAGASLSTFDVDSDCYICVAASCCNTQHAGPFRRLLQGYSTARRNPPLFRTLCPAPRSVAPSKADWGVTGPAGLHTCPGVAILLPPLACRMSSLMSLSLHYLAHITRSDDLPSPNFDLSFLPAACVPVLYMQRAAPTGPFEGDGVAGAEVEARSLGIPVFAYPPAPIYPTSPPRPVACRSKDGSSQQTIQDRQPRLQ